MAEPNERAYTLKAYVKAFSKRIEDNLGNGKVNIYEALMVCLIPEKNDAFSRFAHAWVPDASTEHSEVVAQIPHPHSEFCRLSVHSGSDLNNQLGEFEGPYLFVMTTGMAQYLARTKDGQLVTIKVLPETSDELADQMVDAEGDFDLISGQELHPMSK